MHNPEWLGVTNATIELFDSRVRCGELLRKKDVKKVANAIIESNVNQVIFSAMCLGWKNLAILLKEKNPNIKIKVFWHGNHSQVSEPYGWARNIEIIELHKQNIIDVFATCKESLINFYKEEGYKTAFITNTVKLNKKIKELLETKILNRRILKAYPKYRINIIKKYSKTKHEKLKDKIEKVKDKLKNS